MAKKDDDKAKAKAKESADWERGFVIGMESADAAMRRMRLALRKNPIKGDPYWAGYARAVNIACDHIASLLRKAAHEEH